MSDRTGLRVSVIIPAYNRRSTLAASIRSAAAQTHQPIEIVVVDDASTDDTHEELLRLTEESANVSLVYERHTKNLGGGAARNTGVRHARGDIVAFLDSDDTWEPNKLERQLAVLASAESPDRTIVYSQVSLHVRGRRHVLPAQGKAASTSVTDYLYLQYGLMQTSTLLLPRHLALKAPIDPDLRRHQDVFLCMELERIGADFGFVAEPLVEWSVDPSQDRISSNPQAEPSLLWLERYGDRLGAAARCAFEARVLAPLLGQSGQRSSALRLIADARREGIVDFREAGVLTLRAILPTRLQTTARRSAERLLGRHVPR